MYRNILHNALQHLLCLCACVCVYVYVCVCVCVCLEQTALQMYKMVLTYHIFSRTQSFCSADGTQQCVQPSEHRRLKLHFVLSFCGIRVLGSVSLHQPLSGSERLVDAVGFSRGTGACRAALRRSGASGDHAVAQRGRSRICADPLYDAGQTV